MNENVKNSKPNLKAKLKTVSRKVWQRRVSYLFIIPALVWFTIFCYVPILGVVVSIKEFSFQGGIWGSAIADPWYKWYELFLTSNSFWIIVKNTVVVSLLKLITGFPAPIILALMLNEVRNKHFKKTVQTISYLPYFVSWVIVAAMMNQLLTPYGGQGPLNKIIQLLTGSENPKYIYGAKEYFYPLILLTNVWKGVGWGSIVYLAAITGVNPSLYEAAALDGAGRFRMMWNITLPSIKTTIGLLFILALGGIMSAGYDQIYVFMTPGNYDYSNVLDIYIIENGINNARYEIATAAQFFQSVIALAFVLIGNYVSDKTTGVSLW